MQKEDKTLGLGTVEEMWVGIFNNSQLAHEQYCLASYAIILIFREVQIFSKRVQFSLKFFLVIGKIKVSLGDTMDGNESVIKDAI